MNDELDLTPTFWRSDALRHRVSAVALLGVLGSIAWLTIAMYNQQFTSTADVTIHASRAGLQMRKGTIVKLRGVDVGRIGSATLNPDGTVNIGLRLKPAMIGEIPANVYVSLEQLTAFGNKSVVLTVPPGEAADPLHLAAGDVINADHVSVEVNTLFDDLDRLIAALPPAQVNQTLGSIASSLQGQGTNLGHTIDVLNDYLGKINRDMPQLKRDFEGGAKVLDVYASATPDLLSFLSNISTTADTIADQKATFGGFLDSLDQVSTAGRTFLDQNGQSLSDLLRTSVPTTELLARYSPMFSCFLRQMDRANKLQEANFGTSVPGVTAILSVIGAGNEAYQNPANVPVMGANIGPQCHGGAGYDGSYIPRSMMQSFDRGGMPGPAGPTKDQVGLSNEPLSIQLFGPLALQGGAR